MQKDSRILVAGGIRAAITRALKHAGHNGIIEFSVDPDWTNQALANAVFENHKPEYVFMSGGKSGGMNINNAHPASLMINNWLMQDNVIGALITNMHTAKITNSDHVEIWGTGNPRREFIFADDLAEACLMVMTQYSGESPINPGPGGDISIGDLAGHIKNVVGFKGELVFDTSKSDGMLRKELDSRQLAKMG